jgi:polysaccharide export outer membrane protein
MAQVDPGQVQPAGEAALGSPAQLSESYRVQPTDVLVIEVVNEPKLAAKQFRVSSNGEVSYPFIGAVPAAGRTVVEIQREIKRLLEIDYLVDAQVIVQVGEFRKQQVSVFGQVNRPGLIDIPPERRLTVIEAIAAAGGLTRLARPSHIELTRQGIAEKMRLRFSQLQDPEQPPVYVEPNDLIYVPESRI